MKRRIMTALICCLLAALLIPTVLADTGPKPSVVIDFEYDRETWEANGKIPYYVTLLSEERGTGPYSAVEKASDITENPENAGDAFAAYSDPDGFYYLGYHQECSEWDRFAWKYYPPKRFKVLIYFPEQNAFEVSPVPIERYAFDSFYTVREDSTGEPHLVAERAYGFGMQAAGFLFRLGLTILLELAVALLFAYRKKRQILIVLLTNLATQTLLNLLFCIHGYVPSWFLYVALYGLWELGVMVLEALIYAWLIPLSKEREKRRRAVLYAVTANLLSFWIGYMLSDSLRYLF